MKRVLVALMFVAFWSVAISNTAMAQEEGGGFGGPCNVGLLSCGPWPQHTASTGWGYGGNTHGCMICVLNGSIEQDAPVCHSCSESMPEPQRLAYEATLKAARSGDASVMLAAGMNTHGRVFFNARRATIQVTAPCDPSRIVASVKVTDAAQIRLAMRLPSADAISTIAATAERK